MEAEATREQRDGRANGARTIEPRNRLAVSIPELSSLVGVDEKTLRIWSRERGMPSYRVGRRVLVVVSEFLDWLRRFREEPERDPEQELGTLLSRLGRESDFGSGG